MTVLTSELSASAKEASRAASLPYQEILTQLIHFGLSENEARVYIYLLEHGLEAGGSKIALDTGLHRQYVYRVLPRLLENGLIEEIAHGKQHKYRARVPGQIERIARKKIVEAEEIVKELQKFSKIGHEQEFEIIQGIPAIQRYEIERLLSVRPESTQYFIGGASAGFLSLMGDLYEHKYTPLAIKKRLKTKYLGYPNEYSVMGTKHGPTKQSFEFRYLPKFPKGVVNMMILNDTLSFYTYVNPPLLYVIKSQIVADNYRNFFEMLWEMAKE